MATQDERASGIMIEKDLVIMGEKALDITGEKALGILVETGGFTAEATAGVSTAEVLESWNNGMME